MDDKEKYFSEEYDPGSATDTKAKNKERKLFEHIQDEQEHKEPYKSGKPHRTVIRAKITHD